MRKRTKYSPSRVSASPTKDLLRTRMLEAGFELTAQQINQLWKYHSLIRENNGDRDLTRITGFEPMVLKHYIDSLLPSKWIEIPSPVLDIGTGAGFPGIPLKILKPELEVILAEPRPRRVEFLEKVIGALKLKKIEVFGHKVTSRSFNRPVAAIITRAFEIIPKTLLRTSAALDQGGLAIFLKGPQCDEELREALNEGSGFSLVQDKSYRLLQTSHQRRLIVLKKQCPRSTSSSPPPEASA